MESRLGAKRAIGKDIMEIPQHRSLLKNRRHPASRSRRKAVMMSSLGHLTQMGVAEMRLRGRHRLGPRRCEHRALLQERHAKGDLEKKKPVKDE